MKKLSLVLSILTALPCYTVHAINWRTGIQVGGKSLAICSMFAANVGLNKAVEYGSEHLVLRALPTKNTLIRWACCGVATMAAKFVITSKIIDPLCTQIIRNSLIPSVDQVGSRMQKTYKKVCSIGSDTISWHSDWRFSMIPMPNMLRFGLACGAAITQNLYKKQLHKTLSTFSASSFFRNIRALFTGKS